MKLDRPGIRRRSLRFLILSYRRGSVSVRPPHVDRARVRALRGTPPEAPRVRKERRAASDCDHDSVPAHGAGKRAAANDVLKGRPHQACERATAGHSAKRTPRRDLRLQSFMASQQHGRSVRSSAVALRVPARPVRALKVPGIRRVGGRWGRPRPGIYSLIRQLSISSLRLIGSKLSRSFARS